MDNEAIKWQKCAICGEQKQRIIREANKPDFATCDSCKSIFVLEDGGQFRMLYGHVSPTYPRTLRFARKKWRTYFEIRATAEKERSGELTEDLPAQLKSTAKDAIHGAYADHDDAILALEAEKSDIFYSRVKKEEPPPRKLAETGELPNIDDLFEAFEEQEKKDKPDS
jgi:hypothetical protein